MTTPIYQITNESLTPVLDSSSMSSVNTLGLVTSGSNDPIYGTATELYTYAAIKSINTLDLDLKLHMSGATDTVDSTTVTSWDKPLSFYIALGTGGLARAVGLSFVVPVIDQGSASINGAVGLDDIAAGQWSVTMNASTITVDGPSYSTTTGTLVANEATQVLVTFDPVLDKIKLSYHTPTSGVVTLIDATHAFHSTTGFDPTFSGQGTTENNSVVSVAGITYTDLFTEFRVYDESYTTFDHSTVITGYSHYHGETAAPEFEDINTIDNVFDEGRFGELSGFTKSTYIRKKYKIIQNFTSSFDIVKEWMGAHDTVVSYSGDTTGSLNGTASAQISVNNGSSIVNPFTEASGVSYAIDGSSTATGISVNGLPAGQEEDFVKGVIPVTVSATGAGTVVLTLTDSRGTGLDVTDTHTITFS